MYPVQKHGFLSLDAGILAACFLIFGSIAFVTPVGAQTRDSITNLAQLTKTLELRRETIARELGTRTREPFSPVTQTQAL